MLITYVLKPAAFWDLSGGPLQLKIPQVLTLLLSPSSYPFWNRGCPFWSPKASSDLWIIILHVDRLKTRGWSKLENQRKYQCLVTFYKILFGYYYIDRKSMQTYIWTNKNYAASHSCKLSPKVFRTNHFKSFFNRYVEDWKALPSHVVNSSIFS